MVAELHLVALGDGTFKDRKIVASHCVVCQAAPTHGAPATAAVCENSHILSSSLQDLDRGTAHLGLVVVVKQSKKSATRGAYLAPPPLSAGSFARCRHPHGTWSFVARQRTGAVTPKAASPSRPGPSQHRVSHRA
jgi:hypothetical protein